MTTFDCSKYNKTRENDVKADGRVAAYFALKSAWKHRSKNGLTASQLAFSLGKDKGYVSRVLNGSTRTITLETLYVFLEALGFSLKLEPKAIEHICRPNFDARPIVGDKISFAPQTPNAVATAGVTTSRVQFDTRL